MSDFQTLYLTKIQPILDRLEAQRSGVFYAAVVSRILLFVALTIFFSLFYGFLKIFEGNAPGQDLFAYFKWFFYLVSGIILVAILQNAIKAFLILIKPELKPDIRLIYFSAFLLTIMVFFLASAIGKFYLGDNFGFFTFIKWTGAIFGIIFLALTASSLSKKEIQFAQQIKAEILPLMATFVQKSTKYDSKKYVLQTFFEQSKLFNITNIWKYEGSNLISGSYESVNFEFSQLFVQEREERNSGGKTDVRINDLFKGIFYHANFNKKFKGKTLIKPDISRKIFGELFGEMLNASLGFDNTHLVQLEDVEFEKEFAVYSTDQIEARYILTPSFMERLLKLRREIGQDIYISFSENKIFLTLPSSMDLLSPMVLKKINEQDCIEPIFNLIKLLLEMAGELHLNVKIWDIEG